MKTKIFILLTVFSCVFACNLKAQTSVYMCSQTGAFGYCYGTANTNTCAYNACVNYGGQMPYRVFSTNDLGYGAIAVGKNVNGANVISVAAGYNNLNDAKERAKIECSNRGGYNVYIHDSWLDE